MPFAARDLRESALHSSLAAPPEPLFSRDGLLCVGLLCLCLLLTWPFAEIGIDDDWCYSLIAWHFARTGHLNFYGWASPMLGWQAVWGGLAARFFGPTYTVLRLSLLPISLATALLYHAILRRFGLNRAHAIFGTLTFTLSPLFIPLADTFMTDVTSVFAILVCLYLCQLALAARSAQKAVFWLTAAALINIGLGTVRQVAWLGVLILVPCCGWLLRKRRGIPAATVVLWIAGVLSVAAMLHWFNHQPYTAPEQLIPGKPNGTALHNLVGSVWRTLLALPLFSLPVLAAAVPRTRSLGRARLRKLAAVFCGFLLLAAALCFRQGLGKFAPPWLGNVVSSRGLMATGGLFTPFPEAPQMALFLLLAFFLLCVLSFLAVLFKSRSASSSPAPPSEPVPMRMQVAVLLLPFLTVYCVLLAPRAAFFGMFDRYLLEILAIVLVYLLRWHQDRIQAQIPAFGVVALLLFAFVAVGGTHDLFAMERARAQILREPQAAGVPRTALRGEFEFDAVTEVNVQGYLNDHRILNPKSAYHAPPESGKPDPCGYWFQSYTPSVHPLYAVAAGPSSSCLGLSSFPAVAYWTWLPPSKRRLFIGVVHPSHSANGL